MIVDLKPYPEYKESGLPWLGAIPGSWTVKRAKSVFERLDKRSKTGREQLLTVSSARGIVPRNTANVTMFKAESYVGYKLCWPDDLVINSLWAWAGGLGVSKHHGIISSAYGVYRLRQDAPLIPAFVHEVVRSLPFNWELRVRSKGVWISRLQMTDIAFLDAPIFIPPREEQEVIVKFLEWANERLEKAIRAKRKVIALLNEQKQAIIHRAVTRGLDPSVPIKPSGIPWLGAMPKHWDTRKIKFLVSTLGGMTPNKGAARFWDGTVPWVSPKDMKRRVISDSQDHITETAIRETNITLIQPPAVLIVVRGMILGRTFPTALTAVPVTVNQDMKALITKPELNADFFVSLLTGIKQEILKLIEESGHGTKCLRTDSWANLYVPLPPLAEQLNIGETLTSQTAGVDTAIRQHENEIKLLHEYRARLVADVVTGKLDVREAATHLPDAGEADIPEVDEAELDPEEADEEVIA